MRSPMCKSRGTGPTIRKRTLRAGAAVLAGLLLTACETAPTVEAPVPASPALGPGARSLKGTDAALLFSSVCVEPYPSISKAQAALAQAGFRANPQTGTFYDGKRDASFKVNRVRSGTQCSMVFSSKDNPLQIATAMGLAGGSGAGDGEGTPVLRIDPNTNRVETKSAAGSTMTFTPTIRNNGKLYYRAALDP